MKQTKTIHQRVVPLVFTPFIYTPNVKSEWIRSPKRYCGKTWVVYY